MSKLKQFLAEWQGLLMIAPSVALLVMLGEFFGLWQGLEWGAVDRFFRLRPVEPVDQRIAVVTIDESDLTQIGKWPFPDAVLAELLQKIKLQQPRAIGIDLYRDLPVEPGHQDLVAVFNSTPNLIGVEKALGNPVAPPPTLKAANQTAMADMVTDADGKVRRALISAGTADGKIQLGLGVRLALMYLEAEKITPAADKKNPSHVKLGKTTITPLQSNTRGYARGDTGGYQILLNYRGLEDRFPTIPMRDILADRIPPEILRDRIVLIGVTAPSLNDLFPTPYSSTIFAPPTKTPGVVVHANIASQILSAALEGRPLLQVWPSSAHNLWIFTWSFTGAAGCWFLLQTSRVGKNLFFGWIFLGIFTLGVILVGGTYLVFLLGGVIPVASPLVALYSAAVAISFYHDRLQLKIANQKLATANQQLEDYSHTLEIKVEERTVELEKAKKAALAASEAKSEFLSNMSHELRTPLNGILGYAQILRRDKSLDDKQRHGIKIIEDCGSYLLNLINDILDLSKIEARKMELYPKDFHFPSFLQGVGQICQVKAEQKDIAFNLEQLPGLPQGVCADEKRLRQVLINLLGNAIKFTDAGGVTLRVGLLFGATPVLSENIHQIRFEIEDTGVGMTPEQLNKIFLPFEQVGDTERMIEGTGLGLAISQKIVQMMGSKLEVKSQKGVGTTFWFDVAIPASTSETEAVATVAAKNIIGYKGDRQKILVVDDSWENRSFLLDLLAPLGFEISEAQNGREGIEQALAVKPHIILSDLLMSGMDGFEMIRRLRKLAAFKGVPAIAISASVFERDREHSLAAGYDEFLPKPVQAAELLGKIQKHLTIDWIYDADNDVYISQSPQGDNGLEIVPPAAYLRELYRAAEIGDIDAIEQQARYIKQLEPKYTIFANKLLQLAADFEDRKIMQLIEPYLGGEHAS
ncbi:CHASE2 domain-containing protein [[Phormidium] sp. ETS-05]|uniref:CHASE2 domain-containing protein n=1 Tax=[Phormidium] sp. ETS-05 TaxID=222819 RepID=UPI0018EEE350|nr:CHASE2 domain-containing protein [[Phormidium] sp. ETS-05]